MVLPLFPLIASACGSTLAATSGWMFMRYEEMSQRLELINHTQNDLQRAFANKSVFGEILEPLAKRWGGAIKVFAYSVAAASTALIVIGVGAWHEVREMRRDRDAAAERRARERHAREQLALKEAVIAELRAEVAALRRRLGAPEAPA